MNENLPQIDFKANLERICKERNIQVVDAVERAGIHPSGFFADAYAGNDPAEPSLNELAALADVLDCTADELLGRKPGRTKKGD